LTPWSLDSKNKAVLSFSVSSYYVSTQVHFLLLHTWIQG